MFKKLSMQWMMNIQHNFMEICKTCDLHCTRSSD